MYLENDHESLHDILTINKSTCRILKQMFLGENHSINITCNSTRTVNIRTIFMQSSWVREKKKIVSVKIFLVVYRVRDNLLDSFRMELDRQQAPK